MSIKKYISTKDNTIVNAFRGNLSQRGTGANLGGSDILEIFSIFGQATSSSIEQARIILEFPTDKIEADRTAGLIPESGSVNFYLRMFNTPHGETTPEKYTLSSNLIATPWEEGTGLDMESYLDIGKSNWKSATNTTDWVTEGADLISESYVAKDYVTSKGFHLEKKQDFDVGTEDLQIDITNWVETWLGTKTSATASISLEHAPEDGANIGIYSSDGQKYIFVFINGEDAEAIEDSEIGTQINIEKRVTEDDPLVYDPVATATIFQSKVNTFFANKIAANRPGNSHLIALTQSVAGFSGNTKIEIDTKDGDPASPTAVDNRFGGGTGLNDYGLAIKLSGSYEDGSREESFYTKMFYSRSSHEFFYRPAIEARWDSSIKDDRNYIIKSSSLGSAQDNLNNIYYYNKFRGSMADIPNTGSNVIVRFYETLGGSPVSVVQPNGTVSTFVLASRDSLGVYKATFAYSGPEGKLNDVWYKSESGVETILVTGSGFTVYTDDVDMSYPIPEYTVNITNLKDVYSKSEKALFRVYTRNKQWTPNIYTVATKEAPVNIVREMFYKITKVSDKYEVISYSTGSVPSYSSLSYDNKGSYFDLDMSILEGNNAYEISFLFKEGSNYIELDDKFRFRVEK